jgi:hypothetical protein
MIEVAEQARGVAPQHRDLRRVGNQSWPQPRGVILTLHLKRF